MTSPVQAHDSAFLQRLTQAFPGGIAYLNSDLVFTYCNEIQATYFGRGVEHVIGQRLTEVAPHSPGFLHDVERVASTGERFAQTALAINWSDRDGQSDHYSVSYIPDLDPQGKVLGVFLTALEIAKPLLVDQEANAVLLERNRVLQEMLNERDLLVALISHELRTPLTTIFGNAHFLLRRLEDLDEESRNRAISDIRNEAERLNRLVENMLLIARAGAQAPVPTEPVALKIAIDAAVAEQHDRKGDRQINVSVKPRGLVVDAQPDYLRQVLQNLLGNAEKYSPAGAPIDVRARRSADGVTIAVLDRGQGVDPAEAEIVFQPFYRSPRTATAASGAGIGLAVCKLLVQSQNGRIYTRPRRGGGSVFAFTLPAAA